MQSPPRHHTAPIPLRCRSLKSLTSISLIPFLGLCPRDVTGIQRPKSLGAEDSCQTSIESFTAPTRGGWIPVTGTGMRERGESDDADRGKVLCRTECPDKLSPAAGISMPYRSQKKGGRSRPSLIHPTQRPTMTLEITPLVTPIRRKSLSARTQR
ncbi:hypothetical protein EFR84_06610 [Rhizobium chutanense]|uniref:Uncharacterized protein n=1 Tax=Rhizobium chutanense TaxID=2035448 RepID=A0A3S0XYS4_9HYPH|nr:hypothetical protein EFR84_06610 [Rhizobium chutanense]